MIVHFCIFFTTVMRLSSPVYLWTLRLNRKILKVQLHVRFQGAFICCSWENILEWRKKRDRKKVKEERERDNIEKDETIGRKKREKERLYKKKGEIKIIEKGRREKDYGKRKIEGENRERNNIEKERRKIHFCTLIFSIALKQSSLRNEYIYFLYRIGSWVVFSNIRKGLPGTNTLAYYKH